MWFLLFKLFRAGAKQAKKHKANKSPQAYYQQPPPDAYANTYPGPAPAAAAPIPMPAEDAPAPTKQAKLQALLQLALRVVQFALGVAIIGLYGGAVNTARAKTEAAPAKWVYGVVVGFLTGFTALVHAGVVGVAVRRARLPARTMRAARLQLPLLAWESVLCVLLLVLFGIFGEMFIGVFGERKGVDVTKMRRAVWVDLADLVLWVGTAGWTAARWWRDGRAVRAEGVEMEKV
ncbi:hypothetical protein BDV59DRAFT_171965 [Aspergillus ambiguus]|uniref:uncharacterized protein n=1 Tax=Aspergillus ambiguus TaxID=176160 RepID=UPI003CCC99A5